LKVNEEQIKKVLRNLNLSAKPNQWTEEEVKKFTSELRKESKPMIIAANKIDTPKGKENYEMLVKKFPGLLIIPCSSDSELALREAAKANMLEYIPGETDFRITGNLNEAQEEALKRIKKNVLNAFETGTGIQAILNKAVFELLGYLAIFPAGATKLKDSKGRTLPDCFLLPPESTALDFAYFLHTDFGKNFIRAIDAKTKKTVGRDYKLKNRDALEIVSR